MRFEIYVKDTEEEVINKLKEKGRSSYVVSLIKGDLAGGRTYITRDEVIGLIKEYAEQNHVHFNANLYDDGYNDLSESIKSVLCD